MKYVIHIYTRGYWNQTKFPIHKVWWLREATQTFIPLDVKSFKTQRSRISIEFIAKNGKPNMLAHGSGGDVHRDFVWPNQNSKFSNQNSKFSNQNSKFSNQNSKFSNQNSKFSNQNSKFSNQNSKFSNQNSKFSNQNSKFSNQNSKFSNQNSKLSNKNSWICYSKLA